MSETGIHPPPADVMPQVPSEDSPGLHTGTTAAAGVTEDESKGRTFPCEGCGADLTFNIGQQSLKCPYCGFEKALEIAEEEQVVEQDLHAMLDKLANQRLSGQSETVEAKEFRCQECGATVTFTGDVTSSECAYCGVPIQRDQVHKAENRVPVDGVLPFLVDKKTAQVNLKAWVASRWFAPGDFKDRGARGKFNGVYTPYWTYDSMTFNRYVGERGEYYYVTVGSGDKKRRERRTRWYPASGSFQRFFDDVLVCAAEDLPRNRLEALEPWPLVKVLPFKADLLAGFLARTYSVTLGDGFGQAKGRIASAVRSDVSRRIGGDTQRIHSINTNYTALTYKHLLLPLWLLTYRYRDKAYQVVVNAGTGEVQGDRPYSWIKITLAVLGGLLAVGAAVVAARLANG